MSKFKVGDKVTGKGWYSNHFVLLANENDVVIEMNHHLVTFSNDDVHLVKTEPSIITGTVQIDDSDTNFPVEIRGKRGKFTLEIIE